MRIKQKQHSRRLTLDARFPSRTTDIHEAAGSDMARRRVSTISI